MEAYKRISLGLVFLLLSCQSNYVANNTENSKERVDRNSIPLEIDNDRAKSSLPRTIKISMKLYDTKDLKVKTGDKVKAGQVIGDRSLERDKLLYQKSQLQTQLSRLSADSLYIPILPIAQLPPANYEVEEANVILAEHNLNSVKRTAKLQQQKISQLESMKRSFAVINPGKRSIDLNRESEVKLKSVGLDRKSDVKPKSIGLGRRSELTNARLVQHNENRDKSKNSFLPLLTDDSLVNRNIRSQDFDGNLILGANNSQASYNDRPLTSNLALFASLTPNLTSTLPQDIDAIIAHERSIANSLQTQVEKAAIQVNLAKANLTKAKQDRKHKEYLHQLEIYKRSVNLSRQKLELARQQEKVDYQRNQILSQINQIDNQISQLTEVRSPYDGIIKKIKWAGQSDNIINVIVTLAVESNSETTSLSR